ncbi:MAG: amidohydrolase [Acidimicrobiia bacterium]
MNLYSADAVITSSGLAGSSILVDDGVVVAVGSRSDLQRQGVQEHAVDGFIYPGFRDAHIHAVPYTASLRGCSLKSATDIPDLSARLRTHAATLESDAPLVATRFDDEHLAERRLPTRHDLDAAVPDRPVVIYRYCGHIAVANSMALHASGIDASSPDPDGGTIDRDQDGSPTGVLRETAAGLVATALARGGRVTRAQLLDGLHRLAGLGITSIGAMIGYGESPSEKLAAEVDLWREVAADSPIRVHGIVIADDAKELSNASDTLTGSGDRLSWLGVKRFADGSLGGHTAAMSSPFSDSPTTGTYRLTDDDAAVCRASVAMGGMVAVHAIGDVAVAGVLNLFSDLIDDGADPSSLRMEHVSVIRPDQIARFAELGVIGSVQPAFLASESDWLGDRMGPARSTWVYPFRSMLDAGIPLSGSSDCPVEPPHPLWGMAAAVDRNGISPSEELTPLEALDLFTNGAARALREPPPLAPGSPADFVILDTDLRTADPDAIRNAKVIDTYVDGEPVQVDRSLPPWNE